MTETLKSIARTILPSFMLNGARSVRHQYYLNRSRKICQDLCSKNQPIYLEIGSGGKKGLPPWKTLDLRPDCDIYWDLFLPFPFPDESLDGIYSSHVFEHFYHKDQKVLLKECLRVLKPGGTFSISVPNARLYIDAYLGGEKPDLEDLYAPAFHHISDIDFLNYIAYMNDDHKHMFDLPGLLAFLEKAGFEQVRQRAFNPELDNEGRDFESIYAEAKKAL